MSDFNYQPLHQATDNIRLLRIDSDSQDELSCTFSVHSVSDFECPKFVALSYTWGKPSPTHDIYINGKRHKIRKNLYRALTRLRDRSERCFNARNIPNCTLCASQFLNSSRPTDREDSVLEPALYHIYKGKTKCQKSFYIWADAICVDQNNVNERNHQVSLMSQIYTKAEIVLSWIGEKSVHTDALFNKLWSTFYLGPERQLEEAMEEDALLDFCGREYWRRMWIVQELLLARTIVILCGDRVLPAKMMNNYYFKLRLARRQLDVRNRESLDLKLYVEIVNPSRHMVEDHLAPLYTLFNQFGNRECVDLRDRIFSLLSLTNPPAADSKGQILQADYSMSRLELFNKTWEIVCLPTVGAANSTFHSEAAFHRSLRTALGLSARETNKSKDLKVTQ